jgi:FMN phosphatase YigB (HAD superfamily)
MSASPPVLAGRPIRCLLFDLGGTLWYRNEAAWPHLKGSGYCRAGALLRQHVPPAFRTHDDEALGRLLHRALKERARAIVAQSLTQEADGSSVIKQVLLDWGLEKVEPSLTTSLFRALNMPVHDSRVLFDDTLTTLSTLQARGYQLGVVTNRLWGGPDFVEGMRKIGLLTYFDPLRMAVSADLGIRKPAREIFLHALRANDVRPEETAMVGNSLAADVIGAQELGILAVWKPEPQVLGIVSAHLAHYDLSIQDYNAGHRPSRGGHDSRLAEEDLGGATLPPRLLRRPQVWQPFLQNTVTPDLLIEHLSDLLDLFVKPVQPGGSNQN